MLKFKDISIQVKLVISFFILAAVLLFSVDALFFQSTQKVINETKEEQLMILSQETANKIDRFLFERAADIQVMAKSPLIKNPSISLSLKQEYLETVRTAYKTYDYEFITDIKGSIQVSSGNFSGDKEYLKWFDKVMKGDTYISDFIYNEADQSYKIYFAAPIVYDDGNIGGVVVERMNFNSIGDIVKNVRPGEKGYGYLLEQNGNTIFNPIQNLVIPTVELQAKAAGIFYSNQEQVHYISAYAPVKKHENQLKTWYFVIAEPVKEAFIVTERLRDYTIAVIVIAVILSLIMAMILSNVITRPIRQLVRETQSIVAGDISQNVQIAGGDEIGSLAQSFNTLLENLKSMMQQVLVISGEAASMAEIRQYTDNFFDNIPCAIVTMDSTGKITTFNHVACRITGLKPSDVLNKNAEDDAMPSNIKPIIHLMLDSLQKGGIYIKHIMQLRNTGEFGSEKEISVVVNTSVQKGGSDTVLGVVAVFRSLEEIRQLEESVLRANNLKSLGTLSAGMAHEIRNPLTSIKGYAQYIRTEMGENSELIADISIIINEVDRLNGILDRFLTFARPKQPELELADINEIIEGIIKLIRMELLPDNIRLDMTLDNVPQLLLDKEQMGQALLNVVLNAIQAMPAGGILEISTKHIARSDYVEIQISDTGTGIALEDNDKIFEPFFTTKNKGTGLGLAICSRIIENHKGFIEVNSALGSGTRFIIKLPVEV